MTDQTFNIFSAIGIILTFIASISSIVISAISSHRSKKAIAHSTYVNAIIPIKNQWSVDLRENASNYFLQVNRMCKEFTNDHSEIYNELTKYHFAVQFLLFKPNNELHNNMSAIRAKSYEIIEQEKLIDRLYEKYRVVLSSIEEIEGKDDICAARIKIIELKKEIQMQYQSKVFDDIRNILKVQWYKQKDEALGS